MSDTCGANDVIFAPQVRAGRRPTVPQRVVVVVRVGLPAVAVLALVTPLALVTDEVLLEGDEVAHAALVDATTVVNDEHVAGLRLLERFKKNVHAATVASGEHTAREPLPGPARLNVARRAPHLDSGTQTSIGDVCRRQPGEPSARAGESGTNRVGAGCGYAAAVLGERDLLAHRGIGERARFGAGIGRQQQPMVPAACYRAGRRNCG